uniref:Uncharacterized protein n=1 Tax=Alexandrium andersonii TaxID=327968 RepID=A0A7S2GA45_9DINO
MFKRKCCSSPMATEFATITKHMQVSKIGEFSMRCTEARRLGRVDTEMRRLPRESSIALASIPSCDAERVTFDDSVAVADSAPPAPPSLEPATLRVAALNWAKGAVLLTTDGRRALGP